VNDTFNLKRFSWVFRKALLERPTLMFGLLFISLAISLITYAAIQSTDSIPKAQLPAFALGFIVGGSIMASSVFGYFSSNASGTSFLMLPASSLEKWLCGVIIAGILFPAIYLVFFRTMDTLFVNHFLNNLDPGNPNYQRLYNNVEIFPFNSTMAKQIYILIVNIAGAMLLGSLFFNKISFIKVGLAICALIFVTYFLNLLIASFLFSDIDLAMPFNSVFIKAGGDVGIVDLPTGINKAAFIAIAYVIPGTLWLTAYMRLAEKEA